MKGHRIFTYLVALMMIFSVIYTGVIEAEAKKKILKQTTLLLGQSYDLMEKKGSIKDIDLE